ncbi:MAG: trigger factor family protein [bacterium]|nr:trigger factor family protein [bacterium]
MNITKDIQKLTEISHLATIVLGWDDASAIKAEYDSKVVGGSEIQDFRKGKAPLNVCIGKIGRDKYYKDMREYVASKALEEALKGTDISPVVQPKFEFADWENGGKFVFTATIFTEPPDPKDMFLQPEIDIPQPGGGERVSSPIHGIPGTLYHNLYILKPRLPADTYAILSSI